MQSRFGSRRAQGMVVNIAPQTVVSSVPAASSPVAASKETTSEGGFQQTLDTSLQAAQNAGQPSQVAGAQPAKISASASADAQKQASEPASAAIGKSEKPGKPRDSEKSSSKDAPAQSDTAAQDVSQLFVLAPAPLPAALPVALPVLPGTAPAVSGMDGSTATAGTLELAKGFASALAPDAAQLSSSTPASLPTSAVAAAKALPAGTRAAAPAGLPLAPANSTAKASAETAAQWPGSQAAKTPEGSTIPGALAGAAGVAQPASSVLAPTAHTLASQAHIPAAAGLSAVSSTTTLHPASAAGRPGAPLLSVAGKQAAGSAGGPAGSARSSVE